MTVKLFDTKLNITFNQYISVDIFWIRKGVGWGLFCHLNSYRNRRTNNITVKTFTLKVNATWNNKFVTFIIIQYHAIFLLYKYIGMLDVLCNNLKPTVIKMFLSCPGLTLLNDSDLLALNRNDDI